MLKKLYQILLLFCLCAFFVIAFGIIYITPPWKAINPDDPRFDPLEFRFEDYSTGYKDGFERTCNIVKKIISLDMIQKEVENILIESGKGYIILKQDKMRSYLNPIGSRIGRFIPTLFGGYYAQLFVIKYGDNKTVSEVSCSKAIWAYATHLNARKRGHYNGYPNKTKNQIPL